MSLDYVQAPHLLMRKKSFLLLEETTGFPLTDGAGQRDFHSNDHPLDEWMQLLTLILAVLLWEENSLFIIHNSLPKGLSKLI